MFIYYSYVGNIEKLINITFHFKSMSSSDQNGLVPWTGQLIRGFRGQLTGRGNLGERDSYYSTEFDPLEYLKEPLQPVPGRDGFTIAITGLDSNPLYDAMVNALDDNIDPRIRARFEADTGPYLRNIFGGRSDEADKDRVLQMALCRDGTFRELRHMIDLFKGHQLEENMRLIWRILFTTSGMYNADSRISVDSYPDLKLGGEVSGMALTDPNTVMGRYWWAMTGGQIPDGGFTDFLEYHHPFMTEGYKPAIFTPSDSRDYEIRAIPSGPFLETIEKNGDLDAKLRFIMGIQKYRLKS